MDAASGRRRRARYRKFKRPFLAVWRVGGSRASAGLGKDRFCTSAISASRGRAVWSSYLLKEQFGQLWGYRTPTGARKFFERWREALKWQRLKPYEAFAEMIERHWDGIVSYCTPANKVTLGFVEGLNNKIRVIQRRAYGLRDEEHLRLKIFTCQLPEL
jgi:hypothetical protein